MCAGWRAPACKSRQCCSQALLHTGYMSFTYEQRASDSPLVRTIWRTQNLNDGCYVASADGCWDMIISKREGATGVMVCGPASRACLVEYEAGAEALGIRFRV